MKMSDILTVRDKYILDTLFKQTERIPTNGEIAWKSLQLYFAKLAGRNIQ
jgi:hypothetical protein